MPYTSVDDFWLKVVKTITSSLFTYSYLQWIKNDCLGYLSYAVEICTGFSKDTQALRVITHFARARPKATVVVDLKEASAPDKCESLPKLRRTSSSKTGIHSYTHACTYTNCNHCTVWFQLLFRPLQLQKRLMHKSTSMCAYEFIVHIYHFVLQPPVIYLCTEPLKL